MIPEACVGASVVQAQVWGQTDLSALGHKPHARRRVEICMSVFTSSASEFVNRYGGFHSHGGTPIAGWFI